METLSNDFFLRGHNLEYYIQEKIHENLHFLNMFPTVDNEYGEFTSLIADASAKKDMDDGILSEPLDLTEGVDFSEIDISDLKKSQGRTKAKGFRFAYTDKAKRQGRLSATIQLKVAKAISGMCRYYNNEIFGTLSNKAAVTGPTMSDWSDPDNIDPRIDNINIQDAFDQDGYGYQVTDVYLNRAEYVGLTHYLASLDMNFDIKECNLDGVKYHNLVNAIPAGHYLATDENVPAATIEKYVSPEYSSVRQAEITALEQGKNLPQVPVSVININQYKENKRPDMNYVDLWAELAANVQEPHALIYGSN